MKLWLPGKDFDLSNLTRRQAAVFEHLCIRARAGVQHEINCIEYALDRMKQNRTGSQTVADSDRARLKECRAEKAEFDRLLPRLTQIRTAPLTDEEMDRLSAARAVRELTSEEADAIIHGALEIAPTVEKAEAA